MSPYPHGDGTLLVDKIQNHGIYQQFITGVSIVRKPTPRQERFAALLANVKARTAHLRAPNELTETVAVPREFAVALMTRRPEMMRLVQPRALTVEECAAVYQLVATLIETNDALINHAQGVETLADNVTQQFKGVTSMLRQLEDFAAFRESDDDSEEA